MFWTILKFTKPLSVPIIERYLRTSDQMKLFYLKMTGKTTVKELRNEKSVVSDRVVIFAAYPTEKLAAAHIRFLRKFEQRGYSIILVSNHSNPDFVFRDCLSENWCFIFRRPFGRDFGCYKDASMLLYGKIDHDQHNISKIVYLNDSIITMDSAEHTIIDYIGNDDVHVAGIAENYDKFHHVGSFIMSLSGEAFRNRRIHRYWSQYLPLSTRRYSISRGELGFSKAIRRAGYIFHIQWTLARMKAVLAESEFGFIHSIANAMEPHFRKQIESPFALIDSRLESFLGYSRMIAGDTVELMRIRSGGKKKNNAISSMAQINPSLSQSSAPLDRTQMIKYRQEYLGIDEDSQKSIARVGAREELIDAIVTYIFRGSQIHHGAATLLFLGAGLMKKDVVLRRIVEPFNITTLLENSKACSIEESQSIVEEILAKGHPYSLRGKAKLMNDWDFT